ncbi:MAG: dephospho-CoA kinase [Fidelibacterota bacterium]
MLLLGVTGGIGSGKTEVCKIFKKLGAKILDADEIAKNIIDGNPEVKEQIVDYFGKDILNKEGTINKKVLAAKAFSDEESIDVLNSIVHPFVLDELDRWVSELSKEYDLIIIDAPLIFESGLDKKLDYTITVQTSLKKRLDRVLKTGKFSREEIMQRMEYQMSEEQKAELADFVINNNSTLEQLENRVKEIYNKLNM